MTLVLLACAKQDAPPDPDDYNACRMASDCEIVPRSCCGTCGAPVRGDAVAIAKDRSAAYQSAACGTDTACPACAPLFIDPTLVATCEHDRCELVDLIEHEASACTEDDDCRVRSPDCCVCDGDTSQGRLIGVSSAQAYERLVCDPEMACPECAPLYPSEVSVSCASDGHCRTHDARLPGYDGGTPDGGTPDGGRPDLCSLPPETGPCDAIIERYRFDPESGRCALFFFGGCEGNANNFESAEACARTCDAPTTPVAACEVAGVLYPHGSDDVPDITSCNTCSCLDGHVTACTEINCPTPCPVGTAEGTGCARCGPVDDCEVVQTDCLPVCETSDDCDAGICTDAGVCASLCG